MTHPNPSSAQLPAFDPNNAAEGDGIFGLPFTAEQSRLHLIPVPWDATTSYGKGTHLGPRALLRASMQLDLFDLRMGTPYEQGIFLRPESTEVLAWNCEANALTAQSEMRPTEVARVNALSSAVNAWVEEETTRILRESKRVGIVGGDHSSPLGAYRAAGAHFGNFGILHFDAHADLREAYQGFTYSHASIFLNAAREVPSLKKVVQVGIRDFCEAEYGLIQRWSQEGRWKTYFDRDLQDRLLGGEPWKAVAREIVAALPDRIWVSVDIDGLDPRYCPNTGTPVPGGLEWAQLLMVLETLRQSGKEVIGFDLVEVAPHPDAWEALQTGHDFDEPGSHVEWDANVGMRALYQLCGLV